ncbi:unnamed protein product [Kluyveromyces dobzhanskii CBS 2104]|uniref:Restriction of telomere capping protein 4 n=1 Tax=Kluyveromyces dobzhanskii CBS 2104 TaxID=1427455 RepID=A0A0A8L195_9SACH|nr:unnamed protein product [Kluyveromyces dobzhanskii CBS 2104]
MNSSSNRSPDQLSQDSLIIVSSSPREGLSYGKRRPAAALNNSLNKRLRTDNDSSEEISDTEFDSCTKEPGPEEDLRTDRNFEQAIDLEERFSDSDCSAELSIRKREDANFLELTEDEDERELPSSSRDFFDDTDVKEMSAELIEMYSIRSNLKSLPEFKMSKTPLILPKDKERSAYLKSHAVRQKFMKKYDIPPVLFLSELESRVNKHISICDAILTGEVPSLYYTMAKSVQKQSCREVITNEELRDLNILKFTAGYFGSRRQAIVGMLILEIYGERLRKNKNPVVSFWGPYDFSQYVLAPEVLCYLCMEDFKLTKIEDAWDITQATIEFGTMVADMNPLEIYEITTEEENLKKLNLGREYSSMHNRNDPRKS